MSGGIDSSAVCMLLQEQGYDVVGMTLRMWDLPAHFPTPGQTEPQHALEARELAERLGIPHHTLDIRKEFREEVVQSFIDEYMNGRTPNPCVMCNRYFKWKYLLSEADRLGCDFVATGHYARIEREGEKYVLKKALDETKDQSYVLYDLTQETLARVKFPLGSLRKTEAREIAAEAGLINARKHDSQDICFVPDGDYARFMEDFTGKHYPAGDFLDESGRVVGTHNGAVRYTIGQRKGLGISAETRLFVSGKNMAENTVTVGLESALFHSSLLADEWNWIAAPPAVGQPLPCTARTRYHQPERPATATLLPDGRVRVDFAAPQRAIAPGQAVVLYNGESVIGGGTILNVE